MYHRRKEHQAFWLWQLHTTPRRFGWMNNCNYYRRHTLHNVFSRVCHCVNRGRGRRGRSGPIGSWDRTPAPPPPAPRTAACVSVSISVLQTFMKPYHINFYYRPRTKYDGRGTPVPGGGYPSPSWGYPSSGGGFPSPRRGVPQSQDGVPLARSGWATPWPGQDGLPPGQVRMGYLPARSGWGTPQDSMPLLVSCRRTFFSFIVITILCFVALKMPISEEIIGKN